MLSNKYKIVYLYIATNKMQFCEKIDWKKTKDYNKTDDHINRYILGFLSQLESSSSNIFLEANMNFYHFFPLSYNFSRYIAV